MKLLAPSLPEGMVAIQRLLCVNLVGIELVVSARLTARQVANAEHMVATKGAFEKLQEALA